MSTMSVGLLLAARTSPSAEHHAPLGVGVEDLDGRAAADGDDVARALRAGAEHVLGQAEVAGDLDGQAELGDGEDGGGDGGGAGHVALHRQPCPWRA